MKTFCILTGSLVLGLAGCSNQQLDSAQNAIATDAPKLANDGLIYAQIESKFVQIDASSALHVAVASHGGAVRLSGRVRSDDVEKKYVAAAGAVSGVTHVNATMTVDTKLPDAGKQADDFSLATAVRVAVTGQAGVNGIGLGIAARNGEITLSGNVPSAAVHTTVVAAAKKTRGVKSVVDRLHDGS